MRFCVVCLGGIGDALIMHIASYHLQKAGHQVVTISPHRFGGWLQGFSFENEPTSCDAIFLQYSHSAKIEELRKTKTQVFTFFESLKIARHPSIALNPKFDFVGNGKKTMVSNMVDAMRTLFNIHATSENGLKAPLELVHRRHPKRIAIHTSSGSEDRNWSMTQFEAFAKWAKSVGFDPVYLPQFNTLEELISFIYESGYFIGNDSGPGHIASYLHIPTLTIAKSYRHMRLWGPGWGPGSIAAPPPWIPNFKGLKIRETHWQKWVTPNTVIRKFKNTLIKQTKIIQS